MAAGLINKTVGDGLTGSFLAKFFSSDGTTAGNLSPAPTMFDSTGAEILGTTADAGAVSDTATASIGARLIRIAVNLSSIIASIATFGSVKATRTVIHDSSGNALDLTAASAVYGAGRQYETVAASQTAQVLGATGATGDVLDGLLIIPATTSPGLVTILDGSTSIPVFVGGASSVSTLIPFYVPVGLKSVSGPWKVTTGANVSVLPAGAFT